MLRKLPALVLLFALLPTALAAGLGWWNPLAGWQQHVALLGLHQVSYALLQSPWVDEGLIGFVEIPLLLSGVAVVAFLASWCDRRLPAVGLWLVDLVEGMLGLAGLVASLGLVAVGASLDRTLFWAGLGVGALALSAARPRLRSEVSVAPVFDPDLPVAPGGEALDAGFVGGEAAARGLAWLAAALLPVSLLLSWSVSDTAPTHPGYGLAAGQVGGVLAFLLVLGLFARSGPRRALRAGFGLAGCALALAAMTVFLPDESTPGPGLWAYLGASSLLLATSVLDLPRCLDSGWRATSNRWRRVTVALVAAGVLIYGATSIWEGVAYHNPLFRLSERWMAGPGASPGTAGGVWVVVGLALFGMAVWLSRRRPSDEREAGRTSTRLSRRHAVLLAALGAVTLAVEWLSAPSPELAVAGLLSAFGLLLVAWSWAPRSCVSVPWQRLSALDPRLLMSALLPVLAWGTLCLARGICCFMWTVPQALPMGVEKLADASCIFSLATTPSGSVYWTDRCRTDLGRVDEAGAVQTWDLGQFGAQQVEELGAPVDGRLWVAVSAWTEDAQLVLLPVDELHGPMPPPSEPGVGNEAEVGAPASPVPVASCWVSAWLPIPPESPGGPVREVLLGCEENETAFVFEAGEQRLGPGVELGAQLESGAFHPDGHRLYGVALWRDADVRSWSWPFLEPLESRLVGPFNWAVAMDPGDDALWVSRFLEGQVLVLDARSLDLRHRVSLSFGLRAMLYEPVHDRIWAAAAYSGRLWSIEARPPFRRTAYALCGQARDLAADEQGRVVVGTDCGLFRVDPAAIDSD